VPIADDRHLFEKISLEGFQCGLSWLTILRRREGFRDAFQNFEFERVARFSKRDVNRLLGNEGIIRHRGKIEATIHNAGLAIEMGEAEGSLGAFFWKYEPARHPVLQSRSGVVAITEESTAMSKELKRRGWKFVGPTTAYAFMQSMGIVNDHLKSCGDYDRVENLRGSFSRPVCAGDRADFRKR